MTSPCEVWFYHLERSALGEVLPELLERTLKRGWRAVVRTGAPDRIGPLDDWLWTYRDDAFLPHGLSEEPNAERQPVVLTSGLETPNGAQALFLVDGAELGSLEAFERCVILFDGADGAALSEARARWREVRATGAPAAYWRQTASGWEKQA